MFGYPIESQINECTLDNTYAKIVPIENVEVSNNNNDNNNNQTGGEDNMFGFEKGDFTSANNNDPFNGNIENVDIEQVIDDISNEEIEEIEDIEDIANNTVSTNSIVDSNTNNSLNMVNGNSITANAADVGDLNNNVGFVSAPMDNSDNINTQQIGYENVNTMVELEANMVPPNGNSEIEIKNDKPIEVVSNAAEAINTNIVNPVVIANSNKNVKIRGKDNGATLEVKDDNGNIQNIPLENGDEVDLVNEDDEIEEQFVIGGGKSFLINIFENLRNMIIDLTGLNETISNIVTIIIILLLVYLLLKNFNLI